MSFEIRIDNVRVDLKPKQSIRLNRYNPLFDFSGIVGSVVNDFALPFTPINDKLFGWFREAQMKFPNRQYYCEKRADGYIIERGFIELVDCTESEYIVSFTMNLSEVFGDYQQTSLNKLPMGVDAAPIIVKAANHLTDKYCWPTVANASFYGTNTQAGYNGKMNDWSGGGINANARVPMFFLAYVFERIGELCNFTFSGSFFDSDVFKRAVVYNTYSLDDVSTIIYENHLPDLTVRELILELRKLFNLSIFFDVRKRNMRAEFSDEVLERATSLNWTTKVTPTNARTPWRQNRLELDWSLESGDKVMKRSPLPTGFDKYLTAETQTGSIFPVKTAISTIQVESGLATVEQTGISPRFDQSGGSFAARIGFWGGVVADVPILTNEYGGYKLAWSGAGNIQEKFWAKTENLFSGTSTKSVIANLNAIDLHRIDWHNNPNAVHSIYIRGKEYYIASVETLLPLQGVSKLELWDK
jgi:hypothetical protein